MHTWTVALAMALGLMLWAETPAGTAEKTADFSNLLSEGDLGDAEELAEPEWFVPTTEPTAIEFTMTPASDDKPVIGLSADDTSAMAPLPPALLLGPLGIALVGYASYRIRKRGRI